MTLDIDWLAAGPAIAQRLREEVPELRLVALIDELSATTMDERVQGQTPAVAVAHDRDIYGQGSRTGMSQDGAQRWLVVLAVRNAAIGGNNRALASEAGPLIPKIRNALAGWSPLDGCRPLRVATGPRTGYSTAFAYYPLAFELDFVTATPRR